MDNPHQAAEEMQIPAYTTPGHPISSEDHLLEDMSDGDRMRDATPTPTPPSHARQGSPTPSCATATNTSSHSRHDVKSRIGILLEDTGLPTKAEFTFRWHVNSWRQLGGKSDREYSPTFQVGEHNWRLLCFPKGNNVDCLSLYLDFEDKERMPDGWGVCAQFVLFIANPHDETSHLAQHSQHRFDATESDWGFTKFVPLNKLYQVDPSSNIHKKLVENDQTVFVAHVRVIEDETGVLWHNFRDYDSKKTTGYVGLKNQGATCYMNSLLQSLYCTNYFRKAVYQIPTENDEPSQSVALALQRVFYLLQTSDQSVGTLELTKSFGWDTIDAFMQHDVQEFNRVLQDNLEGKMKNTPADNAIERLFVGRMKSYIKCINVAYESSRTENYYDIQLNVKGCKNLRESFAEYCAEEQLDGDNRYQAEGYGLQDAKKGVRFVQFPPVLHLQLKRFEYDLKRDAMVKINDRHEFPTEIDLSEFLSDEENDGPGAGNNGESQLYKLHGVLVHSGDLHGGHYCAFIKPTREGRWLKFDDDRVVPVRIQEATEENFGADSTHAPVIGPTRPYPGSGMKLGHPARREKNAYMLVYIRDAKISEILGEVTKFDVPPHVPKRLEEERRREEERDREQREKHLYLNAVVTSDSLMSEYHGFDLADFETKEHPNYPLIHHSPFKASNKQQPQDPQQRTCGFRVFKVLKTMTVKDFRALMQEDLGMTSFNVWVMNSRQNKTTRPDTLLSESEWALPLVEARDKHQTSGRSDLKLYLEDTSGSPRYEGESLHETGDLQLVLLKHYDPFTSALNIIGHTYIRRSETGQDLAPYIAERMDWPVGTPVKIYEEVKPDMVEEIKRATFHEAEVQTGDIIVFQRELTKEQHDQVPHNMQAIPDYYDWMLNKVSIRFKPRPNSRDFKSIQNKENESPPAGMNADGEFSLELSKHMAYDAVASEVSKVLQVEPLKIRFSSDGPTPRVMKRRPDASLIGMISTANTYSTPAVLYYETLDVPITELDSKRLLAITYLFPTTKDEIPLEVLVPKIGAVNDVAVELLKQVNVERKDNMSDIENGAPASSPAPAGPGTVRVWRATSHRIDKVFAHCAPIKEIPEYCTLYAEEIPTEEVQMAPEDTLVPCFHFSRNPISAHSVPFLFLVKKDEPITAMKQRLQARLGMSDRDFSKVKLAVGPSVTLTPNLRYLNDEDILSDIIERSTERLLLGLDHPDRATRSRSSGIEKSIKIFN